MLLRTSGLQGHCPQNCIYLAVHCRLSAVEGSAQGLFRWIAEVELDFQTTYTKSCRCTSVDVSSAAVAGATAVQLGSSASRCLTSKRGQTIRTSSGIKIIRGRSCTMSGLQPI